MNNLSGVVRGRGSEPVPGTPRYIYCGEAMDIAGCHVESNIYTLHIFVNCDL